MPMTMGRVPVTIVGGVIVPRSGNAIDSADPDVGREDRARLLLLDIEGRRAIVPVTVARIPVAIVYRIVFPCRGSPGGPWSGCG